MENVINNIINNLQGLNKINWEGPAAFVVCILVVFALLRKWRLLLLVALTIVIGWGAQDLIVFNLHTKNQVVSLPVLVYLIGGITIFFLAFFSLFKS